MDTTLNPSVPVVRVTVTKSNMNAAISIIQIHSKWLKMLFALLAGFLFASALDGQEPLAETGNPVSVSSLETGCPLGDGQTFCTKKKCGASKLVKVSANDEVWLVSGRSAHLAPCDLNNLSCCKLCNGDWIESSLSELVSQHSTDKSRVTMIYVHGNRTDISWAQSRGMQFYGNALQKGCLERPPVRYVIFAWKSEMERLRIYSDYRIKSQRSVQMGTTFGAFLCQFEDRKMVIGGFSLGAQIVMAGLANPGLQDQNDQLGKFQIAVIAPALDPDYVSGGLLCYPCNPAVEQTDVFLNRRDRAVRAAQGIARKRSKACTTTLEQLADQHAMAPNPIRIVDITCEVSKRHSVVKYALSPNLQDGLANMLNSIHSADRPVPSELEPAVSVIEDAAVRAN